MATDKNIYLIKLQSGEEVLSELVEDVVDGRYVQTLIRPFVVVMQQEYNGDIKYELVRWMGLASNRTVPLLQTPIAICLASDKAVEMYDVATGDKMIKTPEKKIIV
jgi:hypothetical protein